jgi:hypothetical protein
LCFFVCLIDIGGIVGIGGIGGGGGGVGGVTLGSIVGIHFNGIPVTPPTKTPCYCSDRNA